MDLKKEFPLTSNVVYLDSGSASLKPQTVVEAITHFYMHTPVSPHSPDNPLAAQVLGAIDTTRQTLAQLVQAQPDEVLFNAGATDGFNTIAAMLGPVLPPRAEIIVSRFNHDSHVLPWTALAAKHNVKVVITTDILAAITPQTKVIALTQVPNGLGAKPDLAQIYDRAQAENIIVVNDVAQALAQEPVSLATADVLVVSANKCYGPTGTGALVIKKPLLARLQPVRFGGGTVISITPPHRFRFKAGPARYEVGTPNTAGIVGFGAAIRFLVAHQSLRPNLLKLARYAYEQLAQVSGVQLYSVPGAVALVFNYKDFPAQDVSFKLAHKHQIYTRSGTFCAHLNSVKPGAVRASLGLYNTHSDIDKLVAALRSEDFFTLD